MADATSFDLREDTKAGEAMGDEHLDHDCGCANQSEDDHYARALDNSAWDGSAAMGSCASSKTPASCYSSICAGKKSGDPTKQSSWALPHHKSAGGPANAAAVRNALARLPQTQGLTNAAAAKAHLQAHLGSSGGSKSARPPRDNLFRALYPGVSVVRQESDDGEGGPPVLTGHFARFNEWTEIDSIFEGRFLERISPGAFKKTIKENQKNMRVLFQHGKDPSIGSKPLGTIETLSEDREGAFYEVNMFDTSYNRDLLPALESGVLGASFRFMVMKEEVVQEPKRSADNPDGIPERTIKEAQVMEFGPVTFPAYAGATAGVRSLTDEMLVGQLLSDPDRLRELMLHTAVPGHDHGHDHDHEHALSDGAEAEPHSDEGSRDEGSQPADDPEEMAPVPPVYRSDVVEGDGTWDDDQPSPPVGRIPVVRNPNKLKRGRKLDDPR